MATPVFCCGIECGVDAGTAHWNLSGTGSISTTTFRSGLRSLRANPTNGVGGWFLGGSTVPFTRTLVLRFYVRWDSLPTSDACVMFSNSSERPGVYFKQSDSKIYAGHTEATPSFGSTGVTVTTGVWYQIDVKIVSTANPWTIDVQVNGEACGQSTKAVAAADLTNLVLGCQQSETFDAFYDDILISATSGDYPLGSGYVLSYIPNADGTHNVAGAADFKHGTGTTPAGADITNATTTAYQDIDKRPLVTSAAGAETLINLIAPPNATDYVEVQFEDSVEKVPPRAVEVIIGINQAGTGAGNMEVRLNDNDTMGTVYTATGVAGVAIATGVVFKRAHFANPPSAASAWVLGGLGDGDFNDLRVRFGSPAAVDANPDQYLVEVMIEAEYPNPSTRLPLIINQARARAAVR